VLVESKRNEVLKIEVRATKHRQAHTHTNTQAHSYHFATHYYTFPMWRRALGIPSLPHQHASSLTRSSHGEQDQSVVRAAEACGDEWWAGRYIYPNYWSLTSYRKIVLREQKPCPLTRDGDHSTTLGLSSLLLMVLLLSALSAWLHV